MNNIVKWKYTRSSERHTTLTVLLCSEDGLAHCLENVFLLGFKSARMFVGKHYLWDYFGRRYSLNTTSSVNGFSFFFWQLGWKINSNKTCSTNCRDIKPLVWKETTRKRSPCGGAIVISLMKFYIPARTWAKMGNFSCLFALECGKFTF